MESLPGKIRFGTFEANPAAGELHKGERLIRLQDQPFRLLLILLERPGEVVTRDEIREKLWGATNVDFEEGLNTAVRKLREALGDSASNPRFIETLPRRGYRFVAPVSVARNGAVQRDPEDTVPRGPEPEERHGRQLSDWTVWAGSAAILVTALLLTRQWLNQGKGQWVPSALVQVTRDTGLTTDPAISRDGKLLAYSSDRGGQQNLDIWLQHLPGGEAHQLTDAPADDYEPDISPDGSEVIFRSERDGGGIYAVSTLGGSPRLIVRNAYQPRFSPDGLRIAWAVGAFGSGAFSGTLHVHTPATGSTRVLAEDVVIAGPAAWSPDGRFLAFAGSTADLEGFFLWRCPEEGGRAVKMSPRPITDVFPTASVIERTISVAWFDDQIIVSVKQADSSNLWAGTVSARTGELTGDLRRLTLGSGMEMLPSVSAKGKLVFANHSSTMDIWEASLRKKGSLQRLTHGGSLNFGPAVSADGSRLTFISDRTGSREVWLKDLVSGQESALTRMAKADSSTHISRDGTQFAFWDRSAILVGPIVGGVPRRVCEHCGRADDWFPDGKLLVWNQADENAGIDLLDPATERITNLIRHPRLPSVAPSLSRDGKWIAFHTLDLFRFTRQVFVVPYTGQPVPRSEWIEITDGTALDREAKWAPEGNLIYFLSDRDGYRCIWARNVDPTNKRPLGSIYPVMHFHNPRVSLQHVPNTGSVGISPVGDRLIFTLGELVGNLWLTELRRP